MLVCNDCLCQKPFAKIYNQSAKYPVAVKRLTTRNPFKTDVFIKNSGQFDSQVNMSAPIKYVINNKDKIFFTQQGLIFKLQKIERMKEGEKEDEVLPKTWFVSMKWEDSNPNSVIEVADETEGYYTFGEKGYEDIKAKGYRKLTYKELYPGIDAEYIIPEKGGIKYKLILKPGADISQVKMRYTGDVDKIINSKDGNIIIQTPTGNITDHAPKSFYEKNNKTISSSFILKDNLVKFSLPSLTNNDLRLTNIIVDPWTTTPDSLLLDYSAFDVDFDDYGNVYVAGGSPPYKVSKYSADGKLKWTFAAPSVWAREFYSKFCLLPSSGTIFIGEGLNAMGPRVMKVRSDGKLIKTSSNLKGNFEIWIMFYNRCSKQLFGFGGGTGNSNNLQLIADTNLSSSTILNFNGSTQIRNDVASAVQDYNGDFYAYMTSLSGYNDFNNHIQKSLASLNYNPPIAFDINSGYYFFEHTNSGIPGFWPNNVTVRANILASNTDYLYSYDGLTLNAYDKTKGDLLATTTVNSAYEYGSFRTHEGIDADECNNIYVGGYKQVHVYSFNGTDFIPKNLITADIPDEVYCVKVNRLSNLLYICGSGFLTVSNGLPCKAQQLTVADTINNCTGFVKLKVSNGEPPFTYSWSTGETTSTITASPGTYTVTISDKSCITRKNIDTIIIPKLLHVNLGKDTTICFNVPVELDAGSQAKSYVWNDDSHNRFLDVAKTGIYSVTVTDKYNCKSSDSIQVNLYPFPILELGRDTTILQGSSITLNAGKGFDDYLWNDKSSNPEYTVISKVKYYVQVKDTYGCYYSDTININVICLGKDSIPNVFTPNGDNINDVFLPEIKCAEEYNLRIYNRWGDLLFETNELTKSWDGKYNKNNVAPGAYFYIISYISTENNTKAKQIKKGTITILR